MKFLKVLEGKKFVHLIFEYEREGFKNQLWVKNFRGEFLFSYRFITNNIWDFRRAYRPQPKLCLEDFKAFLSFLESSKPSEKCKRSKYRYTDYYKRLEKDTKLEIEIIRALIIFLEPSKETLEKQDYEGLR